MSKQPKLITCVRRPDGGPLFYVNGELLPVVRATEDYSAQGHILHLTVTSDCIEFSEPQKYPEQRQLFVPDGHDPALYGCPDIRGKT